MARSQRDLGFPLRFEALVPLTVATYVLSGVIFTLPPGPLCDEGMVLFFEGGCDWGLSNVFFFAKVVLLLAINVAWLVSWRRSEVGRAGFWPHLLLLLTIGWAFADGGVCDSYAAHPNGSIGQMSLELCCFASLGLAFRRRLEPYGAGARATAFGVWNAIHLGLFYALLHLAPHWSWRHTQLLCAGLLGVALVVEFTPFRVSETSAASRACGNPVPRAFAGSGNRTREAGSVSWADRGSLLVIGSVFWLVLWVASH